MFSVYYCTILAVSACAVYAAISTDVSANIDDGAECSPKKKCSDKNAICRQGSCECKPFFTYDDSGACVKAPTVGEQCAFTDKSPLDCKGVGVDASCPTGDKCQCLPGYVQQGKICKPKDKKLGEACTDDVDCDAAFASCQNGKCACSSGFTADKNACASSVKKCPGGKDPVSGKDGNPIQCSARIVQRPVSTLNQTNSTDSSGSVPTEDVLVDTCDSTSFCFYHPMVRNTNGTYPGYCCPDISSASVAKASQACPMGNVVVVDTCYTDIDSGDNSSVEVQTTSSKIGSACPSMTHTCIYAANASFCCPVPCPGSFSTFAADGRCVDVSAPGQPCKLDFQCGPLATCPQTKGARVCTCKSGYDLVDDACVKSGTTSG